ncbi:acid-sensing ion channel 4-like [Haemaphysalis longicornis]
MFHSPSFHACHPSRSAVRASGLPGLRVVASPVSWQRRIAWLLAWLTLSALMAVDLHAVVSDFLRFDDVVSMSVREPARATFPAVTVCNLNSVRRSVMCSDNDAQPLLHTAHFAYWRKRLCQNATHRNIALSEQDLILARNLTNWIRIVFRDVHYQKLGLGHRMDDMVLQCTIYGHECRQIDALGIKTVSSFGDCVCVGCYPHLGRDYSRDRLRPQKSGLTLLLNVEINEYLPLSVEAGFAVMIHHPWAEINVASDSTFVAPGQMTYISVLRTEFRRLREPYQNPCRSDWPPEIVDYVDNDKHYTAHECRDYCYQVRFFEKCGCVSLKYLRPDWGRIHTAPVCPKENTAGPATCARKLRKKIHRGDVNCDCRQPCLGITYMMSTSSLDLGTGNWTNGTTSIPKKNLASIKVFRRTPQTRYRTRTPKVQASTVLSRAGGLMGMYLGLSMPLLLNIADALFSASLRWISSKDWRRCWLRVQQTIKMR